MTKTDFFKKKVLTGQEGPKRFKNEDFGVLTKNLIYSYLLFLLEYESTNKLLTFC